MNGSLSAAEVGRRVVIRRFAGIRDGRERFTDVLGELVEVSASHVLVRRDDGDLLRIPEGEIAAAKAVPPRPARFSEIAALERVAAGHWPAADTEWLGSWLLRAAEGWTNRANTVLPIGEPGLALDEALAYVAGWYGDRGLTPGFAVPLPLSRRLDAELARRGWRVTHDVQVRAGGVGLLAGLPARTDLPPVRIAREPDDDWLRVAGAAKGDVPEVGLRALRGGPVTGFASVYADGALIASGRGAVSEGWLGLSLIEVAPEARRRGLATHVMAELARWAAGEGAERVYLQVVEQNEAAVALYDRLGFRTHHTYVNRRPPVTS